MVATLPFWREKTLSQLDAAEWESLCDGCARCCLVKLEDEDDGAIAYTDVGCDLLDAGTCRCRDYPNRAERVPDCVRLTPENVATISWLPETCAYRLVAEGRDLPDWHPLVCGDPEAVHRVGIGMRGRVFAAEGDLSLAEIVSRAMAWEG